MNERRPKLKKICLNIGILIVFICVVVFCTTTLGDILIDNTNTMGLSLVETLSAAEEQNAVTCERVLSLCVDYIRNGEGTGADPENLIRELFPLMDSLKTVYGEDNVRVYGRVSGESIAVPDDENPAHGDITQTDWYRKASDGELHISPLRNEAGLDVITVFQAIPESGSFLAVDINASYFERAADNISLPEKASYYMIDKEGALLYYRSSWDFSKDEFQKLVDGYMKNDVDDTKSHMSENIRPMDGIVRNVFFYHLGNGWTGIMTIPKDEILSGSALFRNICFVLVAVGVILIVIQIIREYRNGKREEKYLNYQKAMNSTLHAYRAIYYVDVRRGTLDTVYPLGADGEPRHSSYEQEKKDRFTHDVIAEEHRAAVFNFLDMSYILTELAEKDYIELQFRRRNFDVYRRTNIGDDYEWCSIAVAVAERRKGEVLSFSMSIRNINDVIKREEEQKQMLSLAVARAEAASRAKSDFLSRMSHDIRTPMNAILGMTDVALMHIDEKSRVVDALNKITVSGKHLLGLINEVLDMSRIESGRVRLAEESFNLSDTIDNVLTILRSQLEAKGLTLDMDIVSLEHENVIGDEQHLQQIFMNILGNAVKFTPEGGRIGIRIEEKPSHIDGSGCYEFMFEDTGIGMEPEFIKSVFEPFSRAQNSSGNKIEGTGLGMSIAVSIARMMHGDIKVESVLGEGSKFTVTVYLKPDDTARDDTTGLGGLSVLVADDEEAACDAVCEMLKSLGISAEYVLDGDSAVKRAVEADKNGTGFSAVFLDWKMPGKNGSETAAEIREKLGGIPIIILSAYDRSDIEDDALKVGVNGFISKPVFRTALLRVLHSVLGEEQGEHEAANRFEELKQHDYSGKRVLLVEDNEINIEVAQELLGIVGIQSETALNGKLGVELLLEKEAGYFDLIFMDIQMPVMNGYEAARAIRSSGRADLSGIPIVAMSADAFAEDIRKAEEAGMNDHISKPVEIERLRDVLQRWIT